MRSQSVLIVSLGKSDDLTRALGKLIESSPRSQLKTETLVFADEVDAFRAKFDPLIERLNPALIFLVSATDVLEKAGDLLQSIKTATPELPVTVVVDNCEAEALFALVGKGAADFSTAPLRESEVLPRVWRLLQLPRRSDQLTENLKVELGLRQLIGQSPKFLKEVNKIPLIAGCDVNVMIGGETGTGKEVCARAIHYCGPRAGGPFVPVNCAAIPFELVENELFGHRRGAFTGARAWQPGLIEEAAGGTLFLDEIDCLPMLAQVKLLRFLQEKEYRPLGSTKLCRADVRIISACNLNLEAAVEAGKVRQDLYYRLNIISLTLPPLRERPEDIPLLARHFASKYAAEFHKDARDFSVAAMNALMARSWPGNVRELEHVVERAIVLCRGAMIQVDDLEQGSQEAAPQPESLREAKAREIARFEKNYVQSLLSACRGNITRAALVAKKNRRAFWQLIQKYQIDVSRYRAQSKG